MNGIRVGNYGSYARPVHTGQEWPDPGVPFGRSGFAGREGVNTAGIRVGDLGPYIEAGDNAPPNSHPIYPWQANFVTPYQYWMSRGGWPWAWGRGGGGGCSSCAQGTPLW